LVGFGQALAPIAGRGFLGATPGAEFDPGDGISGAAAMLSPRAPSEASGSQVSLEQASAV
jgi:hypothetical protein